MKPRSFQHPPVRHHACGRDRGTQSRCQTFLFVLSVRFSNKSLDAAVLQLTTRVPHSMRSNVVVLVVSKTGLSPTQNEEIVSRLNSSTLLCGNRPRTWVPYSTRGKVVLVVSQVELSIRIKWKSACPYDVFGRRGDCSSSRIGFVTRPFMPFALKQRAVKR